MKFGLTKYTMDLFIEQVVTTYSNLLSVGSVDIEAITYKEFGIKIAAFQDLLLDQGITRGDRVAIVGISTPQWAIAYISIMGLGATAVPINEDFPIQDIKHLIEFAEVNALVLSDDLIKKFANYDFSSFKSLIRMEDYNIIHNRGDNPTNKEDIKEDDIAEILFTSGTTGFSKGVMLTQKNLVSNIFEGPDILGCIHSKSVTLNILPMSHAFGSTSNFLSIIYCGSAIYFLGKKPTIGALMNAFKVLKPTIIGMVPLIFEKIYAKKVAPVISSKPIFKAMVKYKWSKKLLFKIIGKKFNEAFGGRLDCAIIGGASLSEDVEDFLMIAGIPYALGYGMTEAAPLITFHSIKEAKKGSVGWAITDLEIIIDNPELETGIGEILVKGPNVMKGYLKDQVATNEMITSDGWLITGDRGYLDDEGYLYLKGRSKNVIVGPSGENIYPEVLESLIVASPCVEEALVYQEDLKIISRIFPNKDYIDKMKYDGKDWIEVLKKEVNSKLPMSSKIIHMIEETVPFIKTTSNKIKRTENINRSNS